MKRKYELVVILDSEVATEGQGKLITRIKSLISDAGGEVKLAKDLGEKQFAYPINKKKTGFYWLANFLAEQKNIPNLKQKLRLEDKVIRYLLIGVE